MVMSKLRQVGIATDHFRWKGVGKPSRCLRRRELFHDAYSPLCGVSEVRYPLSDRLQPVSQRILLGSHRNWLLGRVHPVLLLP
jgi:hypothetical protein